MNRLDIDALWHEGDAEDWHEAKSAYWDIVKPHLLRIEVALNDLDPAYVRELTPRGWYTFLLTQYFPWKFTARNRLATTTAKLKTYVTAEQLDELYEIKCDLFAHDQADIFLGLTVATRIRGLGVIGASGLLAILFPEAYGTVDQFVIKALRSVTGLAEAPRLARMKPNGLTVADGDLLITLMRTQARELNERFATKYWTPRRVDMVLWTYGR